MSSFRTGKRPKPSYMEPRPVEERASGLAKASMLRNPIRLAGDRNMPFGKHAGMPAKQVCHLFPSYMHWLVRSGVVVATKELCGLIQEGYDAEAKELNAKYGSSKFDYNPILPQLAPDPTE